MEMKAWVREARKHRGWSQSALGEALGRTKATIGHWETGKHSPSVEQVAQISLATGYPLPQLGAPAHVPEDAPTYAAAPAGALPYNTTKVREVPVVGKGSGGAMPERVWTDGDYPVGKTGECADIATSDPHAFLVAVDGASMVPRYNPGEFALVEPGTEPDLEDDVLVRLTDGTTMIKRLLSRRAGWLFGSYNNPETLHYPAEQVTWVYYIAHPVPRRKIKSRC